MSTRVADVFIEREGREDMLREVRVFSRVGGVKHGGVGSNLDGRCIE